MNREQREQGEANQYKLLQFSRTSWLVLQWTLSSRILNREQRERREHREANYTNFREVRAFRG